MEIIRNGAELKAKIDSKFNPKSLFILLYTDYSYFMNFGICCRKKDAAYKCNTSRESKLKQNAIIFNSK